MVVATWITLVGLPVYLVNALPARAHPALGGVDYLALGTVRHQDPDSPGNLTGTSVQRQLKHFLPFFLVEDNQ